MNELSRQAWQAVRRRASLLEHLACVAAAVWFCWDLLATGERPCHLDWTYFEAMSEVSRRTLLDHGQLPLWNAYTCGGTDHLGNPQTEFLSPFFGLILGFGFTLGLKLYVLAHVVIGLWGGLRLAREVGAPAGWALLPAILLGASGFHAWHLYAGHVTFAQFAWLPWIVWAALVSRREPARGVLLGAAAIGLAAVSGGTYVVPFVTVLLGLHAAVTSWTARPRWRPLATMGAMLLGGALLGAIKVVPAAVFLSRYQRYPMPPGAMDPGAVLQMFFTAGEWTTSAPLRFRVWEYGNYLGVPVALCLVPAGLAWRRTWPWLLVAAATALLMLGDFGAWAPYRWLAALPPFSSLRVPSRYTVLVTTCLAVALAIGLGWALEQLARQPRRLQLLGSAALALLVLCAGVDVLGNNARVLGRTTCGGAPKPAEVEAERYLVSGDRWRMWETVRRGLGTVPCNEAAFVPKSTALWVGPGPQARLEPETAGRLEVVEATPLRWRLRVQLEQPGVVRLNQNYRPGFRPSSGELIDSGGLVGIALAPGTHDLGVLYLPGEVLAGGAVSLAALALWVAAWRRRGTLLQRLALDRGHGP